MTVVFLHRRCILVLLVGLAAMCSSLSAARASQTITGSVTFDEANLANANVPVGAIVLSFKSLANGSVKQFTVNSLAFDGSYSIVNSTAATTLDAGNYDVYVRASKWLQKKIGTVTIDANTASVALPLAKLTGGDGTGDNVIDIGDFGVLVNAYNGYDIKADFNCDGYVDIADFGILVNNYGMIGDSFYALNLILCQDGTSTDSVVGGSSVGCKFVLSGGAAPPTGYLYLNSPTPDIAKQTYGAVTKDLNSSILIDASSWSQGTATDTWVCDLTTLLKVKTSTVNYLTKATFSATFNGATGTALLTLLPMHLRVDSVSMQRDTSGTPTANVPKMHLVWDNTSYLASYNPLTLKRRILSSLDDPNAVAVVVADNAQNINPTTGCDDPLTGINFNFDQIKILSYEMWGIKQNSPPGTLPELLCTDRVELYKVDAEANQTVDSREDKRYSTHKLLNFQFGDRTYRGGLFAGHAAGPDNSQTARCYALFSFDSVSTIYDYGDYLLGDRTFRTGSVNAYFTGAKAASTSPVGVICQASNGKTWDANTLVWSIAPETDGNSNPPVVSFDYNPSPMTSGASFARWGAWALPADIKSAVLAPAPLTVIWHGQDETTSSNAWAYFAKKQYDPALSPCVLLAMAFPTPAQVILPGGTPDGGPQVVVNGLGPGDGVDIILSASSSIKNSINNDPVTVQAKDSLNAYHTGQTITMHVTSLYNQFVVAIDPIWVRAVWNQQNPMNSTSFSLTIPFQVSAKCNGVKIVGIGVYRYGKRP